MGERGADHLEALPGHLRSLHAQPKALRRGSIRTIAISSRKISCQFPASCPEAIAPHMVAHAGPSQAPCRLGAKRKSMRFAPGTRSASSINPRLSSASHRCARLYHKHGRIAATAAPSGLTSGARSSRILIRKAPIGPLACPTARLLQRSLGPGTIFRSPP
jgi:hypothetical protein